jgi:hypothetical protein
MWDSVRESVVRRWEVASWCLEACDDDDDEEEEEEDELKVEVIVWVLV